MPTATLKNWKSISCDKSITWSAAAKKKALGVLMIVHDCSSPASECKCRRPCVKERRRLHGPGGLAASLPVVRSDSMD